MATKIPLMHHQLLENCRVWSGKSNKKLLWHPKSHGDPIMLEFISPFLLTLMHQPRIFDPPTLQYTNTNCGILSFPKQQTLNLAFFNKLLLSHRKVNSVNFTFCEYFPKTTSNSPSFIRTTPTLSMFFQFDSQKNIIEEG